ncbi:MAG: EscU/YscU/HrcU family type III secretion system export apparatus switch protein [Thermosulfidibacteraceae bacterium]
MKKKYKDKKAIALKYDPGKEEVPIVIAKGKGYLAEKIIEVARKHDIIIEENKVLAESLYNIEVGEEIPPELYEAIAIIIAFVFKVKNKLNKQS